MVLGQTGWAIVAITLAFGIATIMAFTRKAGTMYAFAVVWALVAVVLQNIQQAPMVAAYAGVGAAAIAGLFIFIKTQPTR